MSRKIILQIMKSILLIMKIILRIVGLETGYAGAGVGKNVCRKVGQFGR